MSWPRIGVLLALCALSIETRETPGAEMPSGRDAFTRASTLAIPFPNGPSAFASRVIEPIDDQAMAMAIDRTLESLWASAGVLPAPVSSDAEFLRRVSLDIAGRIPAVSEARAFLDSHDADKRGKLVERLLGGTAHVNNLTHVWSELLLPESKGNLQTAFFADDFEVWLRKQFADGVGYDQIVREVLTVSVQNNPLLAASRGTAALKPSAYGYMAAKEGKPENLAASASRLFLGIRLECAQCHNHPFAKWKRDEFWGMAAFFSGVQRQGNGDGLFMGTDAAYRHEIEMPGTKRMIQASFLDGRDVEWSRSTPTRTTFANWVTARDNPYFARATVNRVWSQYFGVGLVDPVDDLGTSVESSVPGLLDRLADQFAAHDFDFKYLVRAITASRAYHLSSAGGSPSADVYHRFERMPVRGLSPVQLYDSLIQATGLRREAIQPGFVFGGESIRRDFLERFASQEDRPTEHQTSILQALTLMNGRLIDDATSLDRGATLPAVADAPFLNTAERIEALYLATLTRPPRSDELARLVAYVDQGGPARNSRMALADVFWSLLGSAEFVFNH